MSDLIVGPELVNQKVVNSARPEWGVGTVLRVQTTTVNGELQHRVSVQFAVGHRILVSPPARFSTPSAGPQREAGWLDQLAGQTLDDRLRNLPEAATDVFGSPRQRITALIPLFLYGDEPGALVKWARSQTGAADPLAHWTRDELTQAFTAFCIQRDAALRQLAQPLLKNRDTEAIDAALAEAPAAARERMQALLRPRS